MNILYSIVIEPLKLIFEFIFALSYKYVTYSAGLSIVVLSFVLNILLLPLYKKADEIQHKENKIQDEMKDDVAFIKKTFKGDEQYLLLQTYYRQHNYKPIYALRSSISLLLQIPFFMAAYSFLSNLNILSGTSFGPISDLGAPDNLLFGLNILPILMTLINVISTIVYTKGQPFKSKIQLYLMALLFLVLLYNAPSGLSFYYLLNNIFSLIKNILEKIKYKKKVIAILGIILCIILALKVKVFNYGLTIRVLGIVMWLLLLGLFIYMFISKNNKQIDFSFIPYNKYSFFISTLFMFVLTAFLIPSGVVSSSVEEFIGMVSNINPLSYIFNSALLSFGLFVLWFNIFYSLLDENIKRVVSLLMFIVCVVSLINYLFFYNGLGVMYNNLLYDFEPSFGNKKLLINLLVIGLICVVGYFVFIKKNNISRFVSVILLVVVVVMSSLNLYKINGEANQALNKIGKYRNDEEQILPLSKNGQNVIVFMLDRALTQYIPYIFEEKPILQEQFKGFIYYPNTISFGPYTNTGTPALFGGYEYTPEEMNKRKDEWLVHKHNEALKMMPTMFRNEGHEVSVVDPPYANYSWIPDLSIYDDLEHVNGYITENKYTEEGSDYIPNLDRDFFCYSLSKIAPNILHNIIYENGNYLRMNELKIDGPVSSAFTRWYNTLVRLPYMTRFTNEEKGSFLMMQNAATHEPMYLRVPDYVPDAEVANNQGNDEVLYKTSLDGEEFEIKGFQTVMHYHINMATMLQVGNWMEYLKENNLYDNTRIIIASDHGRYLKLYPELILGDRLEDDVMVYNALLMVKDFNSNEKFKIDESFMTLGDIPYIAMNGVINDMTNPYTGKIIEEVNKDGKEFHVFASANHKTYENNGKTFIKDKWYAVHDDCRIRENWSEIPDPSE